VNAAQSEAIQSCVSSGFPDQGSQSEIAAALKLGLKKAEPLAYSIRLPDPGQNKDPLLNLPCEASRYESFIKWLRQPAPGESPAEGSESPRLGRAMISASFLRLSCWSAANFDGHREDQFHILDASFVSGSASNNQHLNHEDQIKTK
jgi:hypothetical protein